MLKAINRSNVSDKMRTAIEDPISGLNLDAYFRLDDSKDTLSRTRALLSLIYERPQGGYRDKEAVQLQLDGIVARLNGTGGVNPVAVPIKKRQDTNFFPLAVWLQSPETAQAYKEIGINTFVGLWKGLNENAMRLLREAGMKIICELNEYAASYISGHPDDTDLMAWMQWDEPDNAQNTGSGWGPPVDPGSVIVKYNRIKQTDPTRPVFLGLGQGVAWPFYGRGIDTGKDEMYDRYIRGADIVCFDVYPANADEPEILNKIWLVAKGTDHLRARSRGEKEIWAWIETGSIQGKRRPTPNHIKAEIWMAIIHGAKGIGYFLHEFKPVFHEAGLLTDPENSANKETVASVNRLITGLAPVINAPDIHCASAAPENADIPVDIMTKKYNGDLYIFAVAMREGETLCVFSPGIETGEAEVIGENRTLRITEGRFTDTFYPFDVHIYKIKVSLHTI